MKIYIYIVLTVMLIGCAQVPQKQVTTAGEKALQKGIVMLSDNSVTDKGEAIAAFESACELGNNYGCHKVGVAYNNGLYGKKQDYEKARQWYLKAANNGYIPSQQNIANLFAHRLLPVNDIEGYQWLLLAEQGVTKCLPGSIEVESDTIESERQRLCQLAAAGQRRIRSIFRQRMTAEQIQQVENNLR